MRCCIVSISGIKYTIFLGEDNGTAPSKFLSDIDACPLYLTPSDMSDFKVTCTVPHTSFATESFLIAAALSFFFHSVRGLPVGSVDVEFESLGTLLSLALFDTGSDKRGIVLPKCKEIYTNNLMCSDGVSVSVCDLMFTYRVRGIFAEYPGRLDPGVLSRLCVAHSLPSVQRVFALGSSMPYELILRENAKLDLLTLSAAVYMLEHLRNSARDKSGFISYSGYKIEFCASEYGFYIPVSWRTVC